MRYPKSEKKGKYSNERKKNIPIRKREIFQLEKGKYSNEKKENIPIRKKEEKISNSSLEKQEESSRR